MESIILSDEQEEMVSLALSGKNILVDACIGSGKTTTIQELCNRFPEDKNILYLTYNRLLKLDAQERIRMKNVFVTNYHGFASRWLYAAGIRCGISELIQKYNAARPDTPVYDVLIIDEYQDIEQELADMLIYVKSLNPGMQIIMVGDMMQKIYDKTTLDVIPFAEGFLGDYVKISFTKCFRISKAHAKMLGRIWHKKINGVNKDCRISVMREKDAVEYIASHAPSELLCLGARTGSMSRTLNCLEDRYPEKFNKNTVYASISETDNKLSPDKNAAIFTTFDSSKGLERKICVVFDFTEDYWQIRVKQPSVKYEIMRNIFCVAASRGKEEIVFVDAGTGILSEETLSTKPKDSGSYLGRCLNISEAFSFKYIEDVEVCFKLLQVKRKRKKDHRELEISREDALIDLSPCIGTYQEACYFDNYDIMDDFKLFFKTHPDRKAPNYLNIAKMSLDAQILLLTSLETGHKRYITQARKKLAGKHETKALKRRLSECFDTDETVQVPVSVPFHDKRGNEILCAAGYADVVKKDTVYELKYTSKLTHPHFLQCAMYMAGLDFKKGILWNTRNNEMYEITIPDKKKFLNAVISCITKGEIKKYYG